MGKLNVGLIVTVLAVVVGLCLVFLTAYHFAPDATRVKDVLWGMQAGVTALAVILGGIFAAYKWQAFRESEPHLTIVNSVSHRFIGDSYVHVAVMATLHNGSRVKMEFREAFFLLQQISPVSDEDAEALYAQYSQALEEEEYESIQWPTLDEVPRTWDKDVLIVEPGESHQETCEFIVSQGVQSVIIYTYFYNSRVPQVPQGWGATAIHDIDDRGQ
ncbi:MAG: hypothetical protein OXE05_05375 [Chloroflexi bacterium]|nr:hypothetical protein [Chloroflexota bacterium]